MDAPDSHVRFYAGTLLKRILECGMNGFPDRPLNTGRDPRSCRVINDELRTNLEDFGGVEKALREQREWGPPSDFGGGSAVPGVLSQGSGAGDRRFVVFEREHEGKVALWVEAVERRTDGSLMTVVFVQKVKKSWLGRMTPIGDTQTIQ